MAPSNKNSKNSALTRPEQRLLKEHCIQKLRAEGEKCFNDKEIRRLAKEYGKTEGMVRNYVKKFIVEWKKQNTSLTIAPTTSKATPKETGKAKGKPSDSTEKVSKKRKPRKNKNDEDEGQEEEVGEETPEVREIDIKNEPYLYIPELELTPAEQQAQAIARGEDVVIKMKKLEPESEYMHRPKNGEWIISNWTAQDVLEWSRNFLEEDAYELFERIQLTGKTLPTAIASPDSLINSGMNPIVFEILLSHYNKVVNMNNGFH